MSQTEMGSAAITLEKVNKWYGALHVLRDISLTVHGRNAWWCVGRPAPASPP